MTKLTKALWLTSTRLQTLRCGNRDSVPFCWQYCKLVTQVEHLFSHDISGKRAPLLLEKLDNTTAMSFFLSIYAAYAKLVADKRVLHLCNPQFFSGLEGEKPKPQKANI